MSDYQIRSQQHYDLMREMDGQLRGYIQGACEAVDAGRITAERALTLIRDKAATTQAAIDASWAELLGGAS